MLFSFVILHYETVKDTEECISSIYKTYGIDNPLYEIVVVDNGSSKVFSEICDKKILTNKVHIVRSEENLGFARGNNLGIKYSNSILNTDYIICANNDTIFFQRDFFEKIICEFKETNFWVLGPLIYTADGRYVSSPLVDEYTMSVFKIDKKIRNLKKQLLYDKMHIKFLQSIWQKIKNHNTAVNNTKSLTSLVRHENVILQGSCLIFSKLFFDKLSGFNDKTFLYEEEYILYVTVLQNKGTTIYSPDIYIYHKEDATTNTLFNTKKSKRIFLFENEINSLNVLKEIIEK